MTKNITIVTGAASGIGRAIALHHSFKDELVFALDVDEEGLAKTVSDSIGNIKAFPCDVSDPSQTKSVFKTIDESGLELKNYIAAAGVGLYRKFSEMSYEEMCRVIQVNIVGVLEPARLAIPRMKSGASMIFIASVMASHSLPESVVYSATKGAVVTAARTLALEAGERGIRVNSVSPGTIDTPMLARDLANMNLEQQVDFISRVNAANVLGRIGNPSEVANLISFLVSPEASYISASDFRVDGGFTAVKKF